MIRTLSALVLASALATAVEAQDTVGVGGQAPSRGWMTPDSLARAVRLTDAALLDQIAVHLTAIDRELAEAAQPPTVVPGEPADTGTGGVRISRTTADIAQRNIEQHLAAIRNLLPEANRSAFDRLGKPSLRENLPSEGDTIP